MSRCGWPRTGSRCSASPKRRSRAVSIRSVTLYKAEGCHLCDRAQGQLAAIRDEVAFAYDEVDITGDPELEARYREWLPVIEIDGERAFVYWLDEAAFKRKLSG